MPRPRRMKSAGASPANQAVEEEMISRQISRLRVYCNELNVLEQPGMPMERHQAIVGLRGAAPDFFELVSSLLKDDLIQGLDNVLDAAGNGQKLTLPYIMASIGDAAVRQDCEKRLADIKATKCFRAIKIARNHLIAHSARGTVSRYDQIAATGVDPATGVNFKEDLSIPRLEDLTRQVTELAARACGKMPSDFLLPSWKGVSALFERLAQ
jgi:hypothetical protein